MTRELAYQILIKHLTNPVLLAHSLATEAVMQALAPLFHDSQEDWAIAGLLHDADYEKAKDHPEQHGLLLFRLEPNTIPSTVEHAIQAHNFENTHVVPESPLDWALYCSDALTAFIAACLLVASSKKVPVTVDFVMKKLGEKDFEKNADRKPIYLCEEKLGIPLQEFISIALSAVQKSTSN